MIGQSRAQNATHRRRYLVPRLLCFGLACLVRHTRVQPRLLRQPSRRTAPSAYYDFAMAHLYAEMAGAYGNRGEYVNKAIDFYKQAIKADPSASYIAEELTEFYVQTGQLEKPLQEANDLLKANPANNDARKILARIYSRRIGDPDQGKVDQTDAEKRHRAVSEDHAAGSEGYRKPFHAGPALSRSARRSGGRKGLSPGACASTRTMRMR